MLTTRRLTGLAGLRALREPWLSLHTGADLYARYEWHLASAMHLLGKPSSLAYVQVLDGERTVAIVPAIASISPIPWFGHLRVLSLGVHAHLVRTDFPLAADARVEDVAVALRTALAAWPERWDMLRWRDVLGSSQAIRLARAFNAPAAYIVSTPPCDMLDTRRSFSDLLAGLSKNLRASLRKSQKRLEESGGVHVTINGMRGGALSGDSPVTLGESSADGIGAAYEVFLELEASGWKGETGTGSAIRLSPAARGFYYELLAQRGDDFAPEVTLLVHNDTPIAAQFSVCVNGCKHVLKIGYDEAQSRFSPGQVLMARVLEAVSGGAIERVSLVTDMPWHQSWRPVPEPTFSVSLSSSSWNAMLHSGYRASRRLINRALEAYRHLLARSGAGAVAPEPSAEMRVSTPRNAPADN